ncbi:MAG: histidine kinase [Balneolaceae bacterium]
MARLRELLSSIIIVCFAALICAEDSYAQDGEVERTILPGIPLIESVNVYEKGSYLQNWAITKDRDGNLFVGTGGNLMHFDGERWSLHLTQGPAVRSVEPGFDGELITGGVSQLGFFEHSGSALTDSLHYRSLLDRVPDSQKNFGDVNTIIVREDSSLFFNGSQFSFHLKEDSLTTLSDDIWIFRLFETHGSIITNDSLGISIYEGGNLILIPGAEQFEYTGVDCVMELEDEGFLFHVRNEGLYTYNGSTFQNVDSEASDFLKNLVPYTCQILLDGSYFVGTTTGGGIRFTADGTVLGTFTTDTGLPENIIYDSYLDVDGTLWLSHMEHISKLNFGSPIRQVHRSDVFDGLPHSMKKFNDNYYVSTDRGLYTIDGDNNTVKKIFSTSIDSNLFEANGDLYLNTTRDLFKPLQSSDWVLKFNREIYTIYPYQKDSSYHFTFSDRGMTLIKKDGETYSETSPITNVDLAHGNMVENVNGDIYVGSQSGNFISVTASEIERFVETGEANVKEHTMPDDWHLDRSRYINPLVLNDEILLGTPTGLYRLDKETDTIVEDNRFGEFSRMNGSTGDPTSIHRMVADEEGNIWLRASREFQYAEKQEDGSYEIHRNSLRRIQDNQNNDILALGDGKAWFIGSEGLFYYDHSLASEPSVRPPIIRTVTAREDSLVFQGYDREKSENNTLRLPYELNDLRIEYAFTDYSSFEGTEYQVKLEGFDEDWSLWNEEAQKDYTQIREGSYRFLVRAKDATGVVTEASVLPIQVLPPWYRTIWAYLLYFGIISGLLYGIHMFRVKRILHVQGIRNRIASDLHDEISATLSSISYFSEAIERGSDETKSKRYLGLISKGAYDAKEKITDIIWSINPENDDWENLLTKCRRYAADIFESKGIEYKINFDETITGKVDIEKRKNLWLIFKEIVTNIARHSEAKNTEIQFHVRNGEIFLEISDDGVGFDKSKLQERNGIKNIKMRANQIGLQAELTSTNDGTKWKLQGRL